MAKWSAIPDQVNCRKPPRSQLTAYTCLKNTANCQREDSKPYQGNPSGGRRTCRVLVRKGALLGQSPMCVAPALCSSWEPGMVSSQP